jgi:hypothetical protein
LAVGNNKDLHTIQHTEGSHGSRGRLSAGLVSQYRDGAGYVGFSKVTPELLTINISASIREERLLEDVLYKSTE